MAIMNGTSTADRFWVVGGEYSDTGFSDLKDGTSRIYGPYESYQIALSRWRAAAEETRGNACVRFTIARES